MTELVQAVGSADGAADWIRDRLDDGHERMLARSRQAILDEIARGDIRVLPPEAASRRTLRRRFRALWSIR